MAMGKLTLDSTFENIRELIEGGDKIFVVTVKKMAEYENIKNAFFFLMAMALGGVYDEKSYQQQFIKILGYNIDDWSEMARKFVNPEKKESLHDDYNALLKELKSVSLREIKDSERLKIKNNEDDDIFNIDGMNWFFKGTATDETGKDRAKRDLNTAIDCMIKLYERIEKDVLKAIRPDLENTEAEDVTEEVAETEEKPVKSTRKKAKSAPKEDEEIELEVEEMENE